MCQYSTLPRQGPERRTAELPQDPCAKRFITVLLLSRRNRTAGTFPSRHGRKTPSTRLPPPYRPGGRLRFPPPRNIGSPLHRLEKGRMHADVRCAYSAAQTGYGGDMREPFPGHGRKRFKRSPRHVHAPHRSADFRTCLKRGQENIRNFPVAVLDAHRLDKVRQASARKFLHAQGPPGAPPESNGVSRPSPVPARHDK